MTFARRVSSCCRVPCAVTVGVFDPVRFRFHSSLFDSLLRVFESAGVAVLAFARRTSPSRPRVVLVSDLELLRSWGLGVVIRLRVACRLAFACCTRVVCADVASLAFRVSPVHRSQHSVSSRDLGYRHSSWILVEVVVCLGSWCFENLRIAASRWFRWRCHVESCMSLHVFAFCVCASHSPPGICTPRLHFAFRMPLSCFACSRHVGPLVRRSRSHVARTHLCVALILRVCALLAFGRIFARAPCIGFTCRVAW